MAHEKDLSFRQRCFQVRLVIRNTRWYFYGKNRAGIFHDIADHVCKKFITNSRIIGLGSGSTVSAVLTQMARLIKADDKKFIPSSLQIKGYAESLGLESADESKIPDVDFVIDGADQIDSNFNM